MKINDFRLFNMLVWIKAKHFKGVLLKDMYHYSNKIVVTIMLSYRYNQYKREYTLKITKQKS